MIELYTLSCQYESLLRQAYPEVVVLPDPDTPEIVKGGVVAIFGIEDQDVGKFFDFLYDEFPRELAAKKIPFVTTVLHVNSEAKKEYPEIWNKVMQRRIDIALDEFVKSRAMQQPFEKIILNKEANGPGVESEPPNLLEDSENRPKCVGDFQMPPLFKGAMEQEGFLALNVNPPVRDDCDYNEYESETAA